MANYHFRIKSDKKKDGTQISAAQHMEYIDREGKYKNIDAERLERTSYESIVTGPHHIENLPEKEVLLYKSPFGSIKQDASGIHISKHASIETVGIALSIARNIYGTEIALQGQTEYKAKTLVAANELDLPLRFIDKNLQNKFLNLQEEKKNERRQFIQTGGIYCHPIDFENIDSIGGIESITRTDGSDRSYTDGSSGTSNITKSNPTATTLKILTEKGFRLPTLSGRSVVFQKQKSGMLLSNNEQRKLLRRRKRWPSDRVRWDVSSTKKEEVNRTVNAIMINIQNQLDNIFASSHVQYINRDAAFKQRGGCVYKDHYLPKWAKGSARKFFAAADIYERSNGERYKEIEFALPNELSLEQQKEIIDTFLSRHLTNYYYAYAVHDKIGAMSNGQRHPHVHLMFSTREIDSYERRVGRTKKAFFQRANSKDPTHGGCKKNALWTDKRRAAHLVHLRADFAAIQNEILTKYNIPIRVDHRSRKARRLEALAEGNTFLADMLNTLPEESVGPVELMNENSLIVRQQKMRRALNHKQAQQAFAKNFLWQSIQEAKIKQQHMQNNKIFAESLTSLSIQEQENLQPQLQAIYHIQEKFQSMLDIAIWNHDAMNMAMLDFMTQPEREIWQDFKSATSEQLEWRKFQSRLAKTPDTEAVHIEINKQAATFSKKIEALLPMVQPIFQRLQTPNEKVKTQQRAADILFENKDLRTNLEKMNHDYEATLDKFFAGIKELRPEKELYTTPEIVAVLNGSLENLKATEKKLHKQIYLSAKGVFSIERARAMAENAYVGGEYKKQRLAERALRKKASTLDPADLKQQKENLTAWMKKIDDRCATPQAQEKIQAITAGILRKNMPKVISHQHLIAEYQAVTGKIKDLQSQILIVGAKGTDGATYKIIQKSPAPPTAFTSPPLFMNNAHKIAAAITGDAAMAQLVAKSKPDNIDDWELLSETEKADLRNNTINLAR